MRLSSVFLLLFVLLAGCDAPLPSALSDKPQTSVLPNDSLVIVKEGPYAFAMVLPKDVMINDAPSIRMNTATGELEVAVGTQFRLVAQVENRSLEALLSDLEDDGMFTNRIESKGELSAIYQQFLPGGQPWYYQIVARAEVNGKSFSFRSDPMGEYSLEEARRMEHSVISLAPLDV